MPPPVGKGAISIAFVRPSVHLSVRPFVAYIANNSRTESPSVRKFGRTVPHLWCDSHTSFKVKRSKVKVTRLTHIVRRIFRTARPTNFKLDVRMADDDPHQPQPPWPPRSKVKVARSRDQSEPSWPNALSLIRGRRGIPYRPNSAATLLVLYEDIMLIICCI